MNENGKKRKPIFERSVEADLLIDFLDKMEVGEVRTYEEIKEACGEDVREKPNIKQTATNYLLKEKGKSFATIRKVGVKRLGHSEVINQAKAGTIKVQRTSRRERNKLVHGIDDMGKLDDNERREYNTQRSILEMLAYAAKKGVKKVREISYANDKPLPIQQTIEAIRDRKE